MCSKSTVPSLPHLPKTRKVLGSKPKQKTAATITTVQCEATHAMSECEFYSHVNVHFLDKKTRRSCKVKGFLFDPLRVLMHSPLPHSNLNPILSCWTLLLLQPEFPFFASLARAVASFRALLTLPSFSSSIMFHHASKQRRKTYIRQFAEIVCSASLNSTETLLPGNAYSAAGSRTIPTVLESQNPSFVSTEQQREELQWTWQLWSLEFTLVMSLLPVDTPEHVHGYGAQSSSDTQQHLWQADTSCEKSQNIPHAWEEIHHVINHQCMQLIPSPPPHIQRNP